MKESILAIDDEIHMLKLLERIITEKTPYAIEITNNALEVPLILEKKQFDLIITDLNMPGLDGLDLLRLVKEREKNEEVIIITAFGSLESATEAFSFGVFDYITKPFKKEQIILTINRAMRLQRTRKNAAHLARIFDMEPYNEALKAFNQEYIQRMAKKYENNEDVIIERSELSQDTIALIMGKNTLNKKSASDEYNEF